jgi:hypothetical protein
MTAIQATERKVYPDNYDATFGHRYVRLVAAVVGGLMIGKAIGAAGSAMLTTSVPSHPVLTGVEVTFGKHNMGALYNMRDLVLLYALWSAGTWLAEKAVCAPKTAEDVK